MAQYVNQSETVTHGINAPVVNYGQIQVSKNLLDKPSVPDTDVGGRWTSGIPGAVSSFGQGLLSGMKANAAAEKANKEEQQEKVKSQLALQARRYTEKFIQGGYNGNLVSYENDMRTLGDSYIPLLGSETTNKTLNDNSSGLLSLSESGRKQTLTDTISAHDKMRQHLKETYPGLTYASNDTLDGIIYGFQGRKDTATAAQENFSMNPNNVAAKNYAISSLTADAEGQLALWVDNLGHRVTEAELANKTLEMQRQYKELGYDENNIYAAIAAASESYRVDASQDSDWLKLSVDEQKKVSELMLSSEKNKVLLSSPSFRRAYSVLGDKIVDLMSVYSQESDSVSQFLDTAAGEALTAMTGSKELTPEQKEALAQNSLGLSMITKMSREIATNGGGINSKNKANTVKNTVEVNNDNNASADLWKKDGSDSLVVIANYQQQDIEGIRKEAERLSKSSNSDEAQSGRDLLLATATAGAQYKAALIMSPKEAQANGFEKFKYNSVARERLRYDPYTGEFWLSEPTGAIESLGEGIDKIGNLYNTYLNSMNKALDAQSQDPMEKSEIVDWMDIEILPRNAVTQSTEEETEEPNLTSEETYAESRELNKGLFEPVTATATVSSSEPIVGASISYQEPKQSLKFSDINWSPDMEMYSEIMESIESGGKADAVSKKGARGLMQLMPDTYKDVAKRWNLPADGINDPELNKIAGTLYLQEMLERYNGDLEKAVAAYNWGPTALDKNIKKYGGSWRRHLPEETRNHVSKFLSKLYNGAW